VEAGCQSGRSPSSGGMLLGRSLHPAERDRHKPCPQKARPGRKAVCSRVRMSWTLPTPLLLFAGVVALLPLVGIVRRPTSAPRLVAEAFVTALAVIGLVWLAWVALWLIDQRW
jgi:hypothetical protein